MTSRLAARIAITVLLQSLVAFSAVHDALAEDWLQFRGPGARGVADNARLPDRWSTTENVAWKSDIPGRGWSSPIVVGEQVILTTAIDTGDPEEPKKGLYLGGDRPTPPDRVYQWVVLSLDVASGNELWRRTLHEDRPAIASHLKNSYASETPVSDGERIYCYFGSIGVFCLDLQGEVLWSVPVAPRPMRNGWGTAASPALHEERLYIVNDNDEQSYLMALDKLTGRQLWQVPRDEKSNWSTPYIWQNPQRTEIVTTGSNAVRSYDLEGQLLWSLSGMSSITIGTPYEINGLLIVSSGYVVDPMRPIYAIRPGASGDITLSEGQTSNEFIAWSDPTAAPYNPSTLGYGDRIYVLYDRGIFGCYDAATGQEVYERQRLPEGRAFTSSPWAADGKIFCVNEYGETYVIRAGDMFEILHTNRLAEDDMCMASPAVAGDRLLLRTSARLYCLQNKDAP